VDHFQHFGLSEDPFRNEPRLREYFDTPVCRGALARLDRALRQNKGLIVLTGGVGAGKTMILRQLLEKLEEEIFDASMLVVLNGAADAGWMLTRFAKQLGIEEPERDREALLGQVYEQLAIVREDGRHAVLLIDDAHALSQRETLREVCGLLKLEYEERRLFSLVLAGGPELDLAIASDATLAHKVEVKVPLAPLDAEASAAYLAQRIQQAGGSPAIVDEAAEAALHRLGDGLPGRMNTLADNALFEAFLCGRTRLGADDVERVHRDLGWDLPPESREPGGARPAFAAPAPRAEAPPKAAASPAEPPPAPVRAPEPETVLAADVDRLQAADIDPLQAADIDPLLALEVEEEAPAALLGDELDSDLEAVFEMGSAEVLPEDGPPKDEADLVVELLDG
jgi:type II secretory pathway predicted ATPase ExeA